MPKDLKYNTFDLVFKQAKPNYEQVLKPAIVNYLNTDQIKALYDTPAPYSDYAKILKYNIDKVNTFNYLGKKMKPYKPYDMPLDSYDYMAVKETFKTIGEY